jgi:hypothetical protein
MRWHERNKLGVDKFKGTYSKLKLLGVVGTVFVASNLSSENGVNEMMVDYVKIISDPDALVRMLEVKTWYNSNFGTGITDPMGVVSLRMAAEAAEDGPLPKDLADKILESLQPDSL